MTCNTSAMLYKNGGEEGPIVVVVVFKSLASCVSFGHFFLKGSKRNLWLSPYLRHILHSVFQVHIYRRGHMSCPLKITVVYGYVDNNATR